MMQELLSEPREMTVGDADREDARNLRAMQIERDADVKADRGAGWDPIGTPDIARGGLRRPSPNVVFLRKSRAAKTVASVRAQEWMHKRFAGLTMDHFKFGQNQAVIYSTHELDPPSAFEHIWYFVGDHHRRSRLSEEETPKLMGATVVLIFCDASVREHMQSALDIVESIGTLGSQAPPVILLPHSTSPEDQSEKEIGEDAEFETLAGALDAGIDDTIIGEPVGVKLACELRSRIMQQARNTNILNERLNEHRTFLRYVCDIEDGIQESVWDYLRVRLRTALPAIDENIDPGVPRSIGDLIVGQKLGEGAFGVVCRLVHPEDLTVSAGEVLKMVEKKPLTNFHGIASLKRQINVMQVLSSEMHHHQNIAQFFQVYHTETHILFRMEDGGALDLYKRLVLCEENEMPLGVDKVTGILQQCMAGLCHMHLGPMVAHRDLKPENIIISDRADQITVKLSDFDTAQITKPGFFCRGVIGTFPFMAPEILLERKYEPFPADIWSMGIVFVEVCCRLSILKKALALPRPKRGIPHSEKMDLERLMMEKIYAFFSVPDNVRMLLERYMREQLRSLFDDALMLHEGMLTTLVPDRWLARDLKEASANVFQLPVAPAVPALPAAAPEPAPDR